MFKIFKLGEVCSIESGSRGKGGASTEGIPSIGGEQISSTGYVLTEKMKYITEEHFKKMKQGVIKPDDTLLVKDGATTGKCAFYRNEYKEATVNEHVFILRANNLILPKFLYYVITSDKFQNKIKSNIKGIIGGINLSIKNLEIVIPDKLAEQQEIVQVLDTMSNIIRLREECISHAQDLIPALFQEMFGDLDCNNSYKKVLFGDIITVLTDYHANGSYEKLKEHVTLLDNPDYALMVRTTDLEKNNFIDNVKYISQSAYEFLEKSKIYGGEIIINKIGSAGNVYLMPKLNRPVSLGMNAFLIRIDEKCANNIFIYNLLTSSYGKKIIQEKVSGAVTKTITKHSIRSLKLYLPPVEQQELFAEKAQEIEAYIKTQQAELENAKQMFQSLLHHAFTGKLTSKKDGECNE